MPSFKQALLVSLAAGTTAADTNSVTLWKLAKKGSNCADSCKAAPAQDALKQAYACQDTTHLRWPTDEASFKTILENIVTEDAKDAEVAKCSTFVNVPKDKALKLKGPAISKGVCWYSSEAVDCTAKPAGDEADMQRLCACNSGQKAVTRNPAPKGIHYPTTYKRSAEVTIPFSIKFPFFKEDAFECLGSLKGHTTAAHKEDNKPEEFFHDNKPEAFFKIAYEIKESLGTQAADVEFVAPALNADPLSAKVGIYAAPEDMKGAEWFLAESRIKKIGHDVMKKFPELKLCVSSLTDKDETMYDTVYGDRPILPPQVLPTGRWSPATKDEVQTGSVQAGSVASSVVGVVRLGVASVGVLLVVGAMVMWRQKKRVPALREELVPAVSE